MIDHLDNLLRHLFLTELSAITTAAAPLLSLLRARDLAP